MRNVTIGLVIGMLVVFCFGATTTNIVYTASPAWVTNYVNQAIAGGITNGVVQHTVPQRYKYRSFTNVIALDAGDMWIKETSSGETYTFSGTPTNEYAQVVTVRIKNTGGASITPAFTGATFTPDNTLSISNGYFGEFTFLVWGDTNIHGVAQRNF